MLERAAGGHAVHQFVTSAWRPNASAMSQIAGARREFQRKAEQFAQLLDEATVHHIYRLRGEQVEHMEIA